MTNPPEPISTAVRATAGVVAPPPAPAAPPRAATGHARRRAWSEPSVRVWWLLAVAVLLLTLFYAVQRIWSWSAQGRLIRDGVPVIARVVEVNGQAITNLKQPPDSITTLEFDWQGRAQRVRGQLEERSDYIIVGQTVPIRVDVNDSSNWTTRSQRSPLGQSLFIGFILLPIPLILAGIAAIKRKRVWETWQGGAAVLAVVMQRQQTPIAPLSHAIRCSLRDRRDKRVFTVFVPRAGAGLQKNDLLWIVLPGSGKATLAVAALWFEASIS